MEQYPVHEPPEAEMIYSVPWQEQPMRITGSRETITALYQERVEARETARRAELGSLALSAPASALRGLLGRLTAR